MDAKNNELNYLLACDVTTFQGNIISINYKLSVTSSWSFNSRLLNKFTAKLLNLG